MSVSQPEWRNGRLAALKMPCPSGRVGSTPTSGIEMCGRYTLGSPDADLLRRRFAVPESVEVPEQEPRFNIAPTDPVLAVRELEDGGATSGRLRWGLVPGRWAEKGGRPLINARAETLESQPAFKESFHERRCLIPADGFYEWLTDERGKRPLWFSRADGELFAFAGIWAELPERVGRRGAAQLRDRDLRAERAGAADPRPDAGGADAGGGGRLARGGRRARRPARSCSRRRPRGCWWRARWATSSTTCARTART